MSGYYDDPEAEAREKLEERVRDIDAMEAAARLRMRRDFARWQTQTVNDELAKAAQEMGVSRDDFEKHLSDPNYERDLRASARKLVQKVAKRTKAAGSPVAQRRGRPESSEMGDMKAKAQRGQLSEDEILALLPRLL